VRRQVASASRVSLQNEDERDDREEAPAGALLLDLALRVIEKLLLAALLGGIVGCSVNFATINRAVASRTPIS
jgi:hypothetical protein